VLKEEADSRKTSINRLIELSEINDPYILSSVVANPNCPVDLLEKFYDHKDSDVRCAVAWNPNCSIVILEELAKDVSKDVKI